jgi:ATP-dependent Zn protease
VERAYLLLSENRDKLELLTATLLEREKPDRDDVEKLLGPRPVGNDGPVRDRLQA